MTATVVKSPAGGVQSVLAAECASIARPSEQARPKIGVEGDDHHVRHERVLDEHHVFVVRESNVPARVAPDVRGRSVGRDRLDHVLVDEKT
jgi:hypothetical protein